MNRIYILGLLFASVLGVNIGAWLFKDTYHGQGYFDALHDVLQIQSENPRKFSVDFFGSRFEGDSSDSLEAAILAYGAYERDILYLMRDYLKILKKPVKVFWDVGSHIGLHSVYISNYATTVHSFDPYPPVLKRFEEIVSTNNINNIKIHGVGLGAKKEKLPFFLPEGSDDKKLTTVGTFDQDFGWKRGDKTQKLLIVNGDDYMSTQNLSPPDLIKVDVEGFEKPALEGLKNTLTEHRPVVVIEVTPNSESAVAFRSQAELQKVFPKNYSILTLVRSIKVRYITGDYGFESKVKSYKDNDQIMYIIFPDEQKSLIDQLKRQ